jgi:hypothetical protein
MLAAQDQETGGSVMGTPAPRPAPFRLVPQPGSRLYELQALLEAARAAAAEAEARAKAVADGIKAEAVAQAPPGTESVIIAGRPGVREWCCHYVRSWRLNSKRVKAEQPVLYAAYAVESGTWKVD